MSGLRPVRKFLPQVTEIEALRSVFPEERCLLFSQVEEDNLAAATVVTFTYLL